MNKANVGIKVSGTFTDHNYNVFNVIDGDPSTNPFLCSCCFATDNKSSNGWLQLDLLQEYLVYQIIVLGRSDCKYRYAFFLEKVITDLWTCNI